MITATGTAARPGRAASLLVNTATITGRNLRRLVRVPTLLVFATVQPVLFVLLFTYAFGGAVHVPGVAHYIDYRRRGSSCWPSGSAPPRPGWPSPRTCPPA